MPGHVFPEAQRISFEKTKAECAEIKARCQALQRQLENMTAELARPHPLDDLWIGWRLKPKPVKRVSRTRASAVSASV